MSFRRPELRFMAVLFDDQGNAITLYDDNDLDCKTLKDIFDEYGE